jgi:hypothetical protein
VLSWRARSPSWRRRARPGFPSHRSDHRPDRIDRGRATRLLPSFPPRLSHVAVQALSRLGVEVRLGRKVTRCDPGGAVLDGERIESRTLIWAPGVTASAAVDWLGISPGRGGRIPVEPDLTVSGHPDIHVIGDTALAEGRHGPLPGVAPVVKQQGTYVARVLSARLAGRSVPPPFRYRDYGNFATIDRREAVVDFGWMRLTGRIAWLVWGGAHIYFLIGFRNRLVVALDWLWSFSAALGLSQATFNRRLHQNNCDRLLPGKTHARWIAISRRHTHQLHAPRGHASLAARKVTWPGICTGTLLDESRWACDLSLFKGSLRDREIHSAAKGTQGKALS